MTLTLSKKSLDYELAEFVHIFLVNGYTVAIDEAQNHDFYQLTITKNSDDDF